MLHGPFAVCVCRSRQTCNFTSWPALCTLVNWKGFKKKRTCVAMCNVYKMYESNT